jgi:hypothetical protein
MKQIKQEYHVTVQRKKTVKYGEKQHYQQYIILPAPLCLQQKIETGQIFKIKISEEGDLTLSRVKCKPAKAKLTYQEWLQKITPFIPTELPGKTCSQICLEAGVPLATAPAIWVKQAETDIGLERLPDPVSHRILWTRTAQQGKGTMQKLKETKLTDLAYGALPLQTQDIKSRLKQAATVKVEGHGAFR